MATSWVVAAASLVVFLIRFVLSFLLIFLPSFLLSFLLSWFLSPVIYFYRDKILSYLFDASQKIWALEFFMNCCTSIFYLLRAIWRVCSLFRDRYFEAFGITGYQENIYSISRRHLKKIIEKITKVKEGLENEDIVEPPKYEVILSIDRQEEEVSMVEGGSGISMGMANMKMDASTDRVDIQSASSVLEHIILDERVEPTNVPLALLQHITEDFADKQKIGQGGFGVVYKGHLQNGSVAVKKLFNAHTIDEGLFYHEATCLINVKHKNVVRLLGYCANTEAKAVPNPNPKETTKFVFAEIRERLLCFEYIKNGSLDKYLTDELKGLEWHMRYEIIKGICNGLDYLHNEKGIIHRDLKPANILVDDLMVPKITDFGISKLLNGATHAVTSNTAITIGYSAPEFINGGMVSSKSDIYSLGSIIMELVTGRKGDPDIKNVLRRWRHRWNKSVKYPAFGYQQVTKCIEIASRCLSDSPNERPYARNILSTLNAIESMDVQINGAGESPVGPISPYPWELLEFDKLELNFPFQINKQTPCSMVLTNITDDCTAFDIQKTGILEYCIEPNKGVVPVRSKCIVTVTLLARETVPYGTMYEDELVVVRSAAVNEVLTTEDIHDGMFYKSGRFDVATLTVVIQGMAIT